MGRPKEFFNDRIQTTVRLDKSLKKAVNRLAVDLEVEQNDAVNEGLELWLIYQRADKALKVQLEHQLKKIRKELGTHEKADEEGHRATG